MRMSGFLVGGIVGVMAAAYLAKRRPGSFAWVGDAASGLVAGAKSKMIENALDRKFGKEKQPNQAAAQNTAAMNNAAQSTMAPNAVSGTAGSSAQNQQQDSSWNMIAQLMTSDPEVKNQAAQIMTEAATPADSAASTASQ
ncbi:hypothetical protein DNH61_23040 [Paenibacillus sambharensis]|uniref:Uncharacterized protein n=1 Tax=Paenibacillus sambharensis TaxID=1803190 RepID=A0A2W1L3P8_9BACL|nr:hypothetical protein [Paenibacillus sambharensis]PZD93499.1 hypothetical protein DNH61_23040 [Paenibacillus sambharensis]